MPEQRENLVLQLLRELRADIAKQGDLIARQGDLVATKDDVGRLDEKIDVLRADVASDLVSIEKRLGDQIAHLRRAVMEYHSSTIGHGVLMSEFEERLRRVEQRLGIEL